MCRDYENIEFLHFVVDHSDGSIFGSARVEGSERIVNFLINDESIRQQNGDGWQILDPDEADIIKRHASAAYGHIPTYRTKRILL